MNTDTTTTSRSGRTRRMTHTGNLNPNMRRRTLNIITNTRRREISNINTNNILLPKQICIHGLVGGG